MHNVCYEREILNVSYQKSGRLLEIKKPRFTICMFNVSVCFIGQNHIILEFGTEKYSTQSSGFKYANDSRSTDRSEGTLKQFLEFFSREK